MIQPYDSLKVNVYFGFRSQISNPHFTWIAKVHIKDITLFKIPNIPVKELSLGSLPILSLLCLLLNDTCATQYNAQTMGTLLLTAFQWEEHEFQPIQGSWIVAGQLKTWKVTNQTRYNEKAIN